MLALIVNLVEFSRRNAVLVTAVVLLLALFGGHYTATHISIDTDIDKLINPDLPWRKQQKALDQRLPAERRPLRDRHRRQDARPGGRRAPPRSPKARSREGRCSRPCASPRAGDFFRHNGLLFLLQGGRAEFRRPDHRGAAASSARSPPIPSLRGVFDRARSPGAGRRPRRHRAQARSTAPFDAVAQAVEARARGPLRAAVLADPDDRAQARPARAAPLRPDAAGARLRRRSSPARARERRRHEDARAASASRPSAASRCA